jgi:hypothetical protein
VVVVVVVVVVADADVVVVVVVVVAVVVVCVNASLICLLACLLVRLPLHTKHLRAKTTRRIRCLCIRSWTKCSKTLRVLPSCRTMQTCLDTAGFGRSHVFNGFGLHGAPGLLVRVGPCLLGLAPRPCWPMPQDYRRCGRLRAGGLLGARRRVSERSFPLPSHT